MNCGRFHQDLDAWLAGALEAGRSAELERHAAACEECGTVLAMLGRDSGPESGSGASSIDPSFVHTVLVQTTGAVCSVVESELGDWIDARLERTRAAEIAAHVQDCPRCHELATAMRRCETWLPRLAELEVDANFTADVLMATLPGPSLWHVAWRRTSDFVERMFQRPAFPMEASFVATVTLVLLTATPLAPWPQLPARALAVVQTLGAGTAPADGSPAQFAGGGDAGLTGALSGWVRDVGDPVRSRWRRVQPRLESVELDLHRLGRAAVRLDFDAWPAAAQALGEDVRALWRSPDVEPVPDTPRRPSDE